MKHKIPCGETTFKCSACQKTFTVNSTLGETEFLVEKCSGCHSFYVGTPANAKLTGNADRFQKRYGDFGGINFI
jgi:large subunit ribosomal protein L31